MRKFMLVALLCSSCAIISLKKQITSNFFLPAIVYANITSPDYLNQLNLKTKIEIYSDSIKIGLMHSTGINLATIYIMENQLLVNQKFNNTNDTIQFNERRESINLKALRETIMQTTLKSDTLTYTHHLGDLVCTKYMNKENIYLPAQMTFFPSEKIQHMSTQHIYLDYKKINFSKK
tara:strand:+ start:86 stop:616 length:531 start_codon:yes stop_codon:yes gene_type:complete